MNIHYDNWLECEHTFDIVDIIQEEDYNWIVTQDTIFYVEGGGMKKDTGTINGLEVEDIQYKDGKYYHKVKGNTDGQAHMIVDLPQRIQKVQIHSASHLICGHINKKYNAKTIAFWYHDDISGCEMEFTTLDEQTLRQIEAECNEFVKQDLPIRIVYPTREEAQQHVKDEKLEHDELRAAVIGDIDYNMCGCIHLPSLRYIQSIKLLNFEKTTRGYKIYFVVGDQLVNTYGQHFEVLSKSAKDLGVPVYEVYEGIQKLYHEIKELKNSEANWKQKVIDLKLEKFATSEDTYMACEIDDLDVKTFTSFCSNLVRNYEKGIFFVCHDHNRCHVVVAHHASLNFKANEIFKEIATKFNLRGGGNPAMAQGGGEYSPLILEELEKMANQIKG